MGFLGKRYWRRLSGWEGTTLTTSECKSQVIYARDSGHPQWADHVIAMLLQTAGEEWRYPEVLLGWTGKGRMLNMHCNELMLLQRVSRIMPALWVRSWCLKGNSYNPTVWIREQNWHGWLGTESLSDLKPRMTCLRQVLAKFSYKRPGSKHFKLCRLSLSQLLKFITVTWKAATYIMQINACDCVLVRLFIKVSAGWIWSTGHSLLTPCLKVWRIRRVSSRRRESERWITEVFCFFHYTVSLILLYLSLHSGKWLSSWSADSFWWPSSELLLT